MHRIDGYGATPENLFTEGDPASGLPATNVTGDWLLLVPVLALVRGRLASTSARRRTR